MNGVHSWAQLQDALAGGATVVTANQRLARALKGRSAETQLSAGRRAWPSPDILTWSAWLEREWRGIAARARAPRLLRDSEALLLWEEVIAAAPAGELAMASDAAVHAAWDAWCLLQAWELDPARLEGYPHRDTELFAAWADGYGDRLARRDVCDSAMLATRLARRAARSAGSTTSLVLAGFVDLAPAERRLLTALAATGVSVTAWQPAADPHRVCRLETSDTRTELQWAARWARSRLERKPDARIGIVVPNLALLRGEVLRIFDETLAPELALAAAAAAMRPFNLSLGPALADWPPVAAALRALQFLHQGLAIAELGALLRSPHLIAGTSEHWQRCGLDAALRARPRLEWSAEELLAAMASAQARGAASCPRLHEAMQRAVALHRTWDARCAPSRWAAAFSELLAALSWPGERRLDSTDYQLLRAWHDLLDELAALDRVAPAVPAARALGMLARLARERRFQPEAEEVPVQIMGVLEAIGQRFDHLWIAGLHDEIWPAPVRPHPFLPITLQQQAGMPHASAERELAYAAQVTRALAGAAPEVIFSTPAAEREQRLRPSPLLATVPAIDVADLALAPAPGYLRRIHEAGTLREYDALTSRPLRRSERTRGGTGLLRDQAACAFRAFARHRLGAAALEEPAPALDAKMRGDLVHAALALFWKARPQHADLLALSPEALEDAAGEAAEAALRTVSVRDTDHRGRTFLSIERRRITRLLVEWLAFEAHRHPFRVEAAELGREVELAGLRLRTRIDRVDALDDGRRVLIDYKTGDPRNLSVRHWSGERPDEPQLPLYAVTAQTTVEALAFASVSSRGEPAFKGLARDADILPGVAAFPGWEDGARSWDELLEQWRRVLGRLAAAFAAGEAAIEPKSAESCRQCDLHVLCRIYEHRSSAGHDGD